MLIGQERFGASSAHEPFLELSAVKILLHARTYGNGADIDVTVLIATALQAPKELPELLRLAGNMMNLDQEARTWKRLHKRAV